MKILLSRQKPGFTLIETMAATTIMLFIFFIGGDMITKTFKAITFNEEQEMAIKNARQGLMTMTKEIREAKMSDRGEYPLLAIDPQNLIFFSNIDTDTATEKIQYILSGSNLLKIVTKPGAGNNYSGAGATTTISQYVNNVAEPLFTYYSSNNIISGDKIQIRLINLRLKINVTPAIAPADYYVETDVSLRNLKSNL